MMELGRCESSPASRVEFKACETRPRRPSGVKGRKQRAKARRAPSRRRFGRSASLRPTRRPLPPQTWNARQREFHRSQLIALDAA